MADGRKRLSGSQYRKRRIEKEEDHKRLAGSLKKFFVSTTATTSTQPQPSTSQALDVQPFKLSENDAEEQDQNKSTAENITLDQDTTNTPSSNNTQTETADIDVSGEQFKDPAYWPEVLTDTVRLIILDIGPVQLKNIIYPVNNLNRSFSSTYFVKKLTNNEKVPRNWLIYSKSKDSVYCFSCKLFEVSSNSFSDNNGFRDWQHLSRALERHETSKGHFESVKKWVELKKSIEKGLTVDYMNQNLFQIEKKRWTSVLERIIFVIQFLAGQNLAFRGNSQKLFEKGNGNFMKLIETIAKFDSVMADHIGRIQKDGKKMPHYLGDKIQNEIITLVGEKVKKNIIESLKMCKYFSIILDCTPDISHQEQITIVVRFVFVDDFSKTVEVREHFLGFCKVSNSTGQGLTDFILNFLKESDINIADMRGQGYDNGANMKGKHIGLQKKILDINPRAFFVPCAAHSLNLVVNDAAKSSLEVTNFFSIIQELYVFFSASTYRWNILLKEVPRLTLKPLSDTRWESRIDAVKTLRYELEKVYDALFALYNDTSRDNDTRNTASSLINKIKSFKFICSLVVWYNILLKINVVSKIMQKSDVILPEAVQMLNRIKIFLTDMRSDYGFINLLNEAKKIAQEMDAEISFPAVHTVRPRRKKTFYEYEQKDEPIQSPELHFKVNLYFYILDIAISKLDERFQDLETHVESFGFLNNLSVFSKEEIMKYCTNLETKLTDPETKNLDINAIDLYNEIDILSIYITNKNNMSAKEVLAYLVANELKGIFPNLFVALRIFLTMPVTVAHGERSFSKLKLIKNYLRSTMSQSRLTNLAIISIEEDICFNLDVTDLVREFALNKARKVDFSI